MGTITLTSPVASTEIQAGLHATNYSALQTLLNGNLDNTNISASAVLDAVARVGVRKNSAGSVFSRRRLNFIEGTGITFTVADDSGNEEVDITVASSGGTTIYRKTTEKVITNTTTETDLLNDEITIGANEMGANGWIDLHLAGTHENQSGASRTCRMRLKFGATTIWDSGATGTIRAVAVTDNGWEARIRIYNVNATNSQIAMGRVELGICAANATTGTGAFNDTQNGICGYAAELSGTAAEDTTASKTLKLTAQYDAASANTTIRMKRAVIVVNNKS